MSEVLSRSLRWRRAVLSSALITWPSSCPDLSSLVLYCSFACSQPISINSEALTCVAYYASWIFCVFGIQMLIYLFTLRLFNYNLYWSEIGQVEGCIFSPLSSASSYLMLSDAAERCDSIARLCSWFCVTYSGLHFFVYSAFCRRSLRGYSLQFLLAISIMVNCVRAVAACAALDGWCGKRGG